MKCAMIRRYGGPEVLALEDQPAPETGPDDVLIDVVAASLNPIDAKLRAGKLKMTRGFGLPQILGCDVAGRVTAVGANVGRFKAGDEVFARLEKDRMGGLAEQVAANERVVALKPKNAGFHEAAGLPLAGLTSLQALRESAGLSAGKRVLIHAGAGGVGSLAIQIAKALHLWVATTTSTKNVDFVRELGADEVIDYTRDDFTTKVRDLDAVFDTLGAESELRSLSVLKPGGTVVGVGGLPDMAFADEWLPFYVRPALWLLTRKRARAADRAGAHFRYLFMRPDGEELSEIARWVEAGKIRPIVHATFPLAEVSAAFAELERGRAKGKIIVTVR